MTVKMIVNGEVRDEITPDEFLKLIKKNYVSGLIDGVSIIEDIAKNELPRLVKEKLLESLEDVNNITVEKLMEQNNAEDDS